MAASRRQKQVKGRSALRFYHEILGLDYLHYGLWAEDDPLNRSGLERAQERYAAALCELVPPDSRRILDVGCGSGALSLRLSEMGFDVEGLSPDPYQENIFRQRCDLPFHLDWFESFSPESTFDVVIMSESAQYIKLDALFPSVTRIAPGGDLLVSDFFVIDKDQGEVSKRGHALDAFLQAAADNGYRVIQERDITEQVVPTLDLAQHWVDRYVEPSARLVDELYSDKHPVLLKTARWIFRKREDEYRKMLVQIDRDAFLATKRYLMMHLACDDSPVSGI